MVFFENSALEKDRLFGNMKKNLYEIAARYLKQYHDKLL